MTITPCLAFEEFMILLLKLLFILIRFPQRHITNLQILKNGGTASKVIVSARSKDYIKKIKIS